MVPPQAELAKRGAGCCPLVLTANNTFVPEGSWLLFAILGVETHGKAMVIDRGAAR